MEREERREHAEDEQQRVRELQRAAQASAEGHRARAAVCARRRRRDARRGGH
jgi:hypothetical protein